MKNKDYIVRRNEIYAGQVVVADGVFDKNGFFNVWSYRPLRSILFVLDENGYANDLLYDANHYPVSGITLSCDTNLDESKIVVAASIKLDKLLSFFEYDDILDYDQIKDIRKMILNCKRREKYLEFYKQMEGELLTGLNNLKIRSIYEGEYNNIYGVKERHNSFKPKREEHAKKLRLI